jgi:hypothetical protein
MNAKELKRYNDRVLAATMALVVVFWFAICLAFALLGEGGECENCLDSTHLFLF